MSVNLPIEYVEAARERRLLPFVGAGFSKNVSSKFPTWQQLIPLAANLLGYDSEILALQGDNLQIAEYLSSQKRLGQFYNELSRELDSTSFDVGDSKPHLLLPYLDVYAIFTTNWDSWIERGFERECIPFETIVTHYDFISPRAYSYPTSRSSGVIVPDSDLPETRKRYAGSSIVKFHGDFSNPETIVFRETDYYDRLEFEHPLDIKLRNDIFGRSVVFIGYSFSDPNVRYLWHKLNKMMATVESRDRVHSFFVTHSQNPLQMELMERKNVKTILMDPNRISDDLTDLLNQTIDIQQKG